jgi:regulator of protease activity HflC (stomatin/prohibitin superfamily)
MVLKAYEYVRLVDSTTGKVTTHKGEATVFPGPDEEPLDGDKISAIDLKVNEYVKIMDQATGDIRVEAGTTQVFLGPHEKTLDGGKKKAVEVDGEHAALVRNKSTGQLRLVTESQLFVPGPHESIEAVQELVKLADHEAIIVKDKDGVFHYHYGSDEKRVPDQPRCFFLPPYAEVVKLCWSRGRRRECRDLYIQRFDTRSQYMSFEFNCRTKDNVELILEGTFFWEVFDLPRMVRATGDTSGDLCNHARSQFIKHVAKVTLKEFMDDLQTISKKVHQEDNEFYDTRGVKVHSLEVTAYRCADASTSEVLQQIIQETTNRMNRLSQAESENEVKLFRMQGEIDQEKLNGDLLEIQHKHAQAEAMVNGKSEADRAAAFVDGLADHVPRLEDRIALWQTLRKTEALSAISTGGANFYYTPSDVNLSIESRVPRD